jgi:hypothetical protein
MLNDALGYALVGLLCLQTANTVVFSPCLSLLKQFMAKTTVAMHLGFIGLSSHDYCD